MIVDFPIGSPTSGISKGAVAGTVVGEIVGAVLVTAFVSLYILRSRRKKFNAVARRRRGEISYESETVKFDLKTLILDRNIFLCSFQGLPQNRRSEKLHN